MSSEYESLEKFLKPTRKSRGILLVTFFLFTCLQVVTTYYLSESLSIHITSDGWLNSKVLTAIGISLKLRVVIVMIGLIGIFHTRITPWTICSSLSFIAYFINMFCRMYMIYLADGSWERIKCISLFIYELETNLICFTFSLIFVYHSFCLHSDDKVSLDMEDPKEVFVRKIVKSLVSIVPGLGFFRRKLFAMAKLD